MIVSDLVLKHYGPNFLLQLACDGTPVGIGAVLSHVMADGTAQPIAFASRSLSKAEHNYAQIDKEALATVWEVKKFYNYSFGGNFTLLTDHEPLTSIFHPSKTLPAVTSARLQRYALLLADFEYSITCKNTKLHRNADAHDLVMKGWSTPQDEEIKPFYQRKDELTVHCGVLMLGYRAVTPAKLRNQVLTEFHEGDMKSLARSYIWRPKIDKDIGNPTNRTLAEDPFGFCWTVPRTNVPYH
ncbi:Hypothetical predicted protein [Paramuricea clavata]|uniref:Uncharacterized protein n=1 Tax=Paramuricea clavata TaxID=317549 RepID=A0A6S7JJY1_PARCT|nr:Hypothetical predicted protein [Paramuricea clavata]